MGTVASCDVDRVRTIGLAPFHSVLHPEPVLFIPGGRLAKGQSGRLFIGRSPHLVLTENGHGFESAAMIVYLAKILHCVRITIDKLTELGC
jgi:hypothetical protein